MNFQSFTENVSVCRECFNSSVEEPIDLDITLPDYCPDISKILKCQLQPQITKEQLVGDRLAVEGSTVVRILYTSENDVGVRNCELTTAFSAEFSVKHSGDNPIYRASVRVNTVNCRAVTKRRVDIHGSFTVNGRVWGKENDSFLESARGEGVQTLQQSLTVSDLSAMAQQQFSITESLEPEANQPLPESLIRSEAVAVLRDYKIIPNKLLAKGELQYTFFYLSDITAGTPSRAVFSIPFSQILDMEGLQEESKVSISLEILSQKAQLIQSDDGEGSCFEVECVLSLSAQSYESHNKNAVVDTYSTKFEMEQNRKLLELPQYIAFLREEEHQKFTVDLSEEYTELLDMWSEVISAEAEAVEQGINIKGKLNFCFLLQRNGSVPEYAERTAEYSYLVKDTRFSSRCACVPIVTVADCVGQIIGKNAEIRAELHINGDVICKERLEIVQSAELLEESRKSSEDIPSLRIYYAQEGESVWNIAKEHNIPMKSVLKENMLEEDIMPSAGMILLPNCETEG